MSMVESIASASTSISMGRVATDVSISMLKKSMNQCEENMSKLMEMAVPSMPSGSSVDFSI